MFTHKEISNKVRKPICCENSWRLLVWVYHERCVNILYAKVLNVFYAVSVLIFQHKNFSSPVIIPCHVLIKVKSCACMLSNLLWFDTEQKKKKFQPGHFLWKVRVKYHTLCHCETWQKTLKMMTHLKRSDKGYSVVYILGLCGLSTITLR